MNEFVDLHLRPPLKESGCVERMIVVSSGLGYRSVGVSLPTNITQTQISLLQSICNKVGIDLITRTNLNPQTPHQLLTFLSRYRRRFDIIAVMCTSKRVARQAAKDRRVDLLCFSTTDLRKRFFDHAEAKLASDALSGLEIEMAPLLTSTGFPRIRLFHHLRKEVENARRLKVPVVISSGATSEHLLRGPHEFAALATLFDMPTQQALSALSGVPLTIVQRNKEKRSPNYVAPGIRIIGRRTGC